MAGTFGTPLWRDDGAIPDHGGDLEADLAREAARGRSGRRITEPTATQGLDNTLDGSQRRSGRRDVPRDASRVSTAL